MEQLELQLCNSASTSPNPDMKARFPSKSDPKPVHVRQETRPSFALRNPQNMTDKELVELAKSGDGDALNALCTRHHRKIRGTIQGKFRVEHHLAEDLTQETFIKVQRALPGFRGDSKFSTWLTRIAINTAKNHFVAMKRRPPLQDLDYGDLIANRGHSKLTNPSTPEQTLISEETADRMTESLESLPSQLRECLVLREFQGQTYEQIAKHFQCPIGTVRSRLFRARDHLGISPNSNTPLPVR